MLKQELQQKQSLSPQQILEATLLQLNNSSLDKYILEEFERDLAAQASRANGASQPSTISWEDVSQQPTDVGHVPVDPWHGQVFPQPQISEMYTGEDAWNSWNNRRQHATHNASQRQSRTRYQQPTQTDPI